MTAEGKGAVVAVAATLAMVPADSSGGNGGAGKNGGGRRTQRQQRGQTTINQKAAAIAAETAIVAAAETAGTELAAAETAAAETAVGDGDGANSGRGGNRCSGSGRNAIVNQSVVCFRKYRISGSTLTRKCLPTYIEFYLCICKFLFVAQIKVPLWSFCNVYLVFTNETTFRTKQIHIRWC
jgi:hypothetical protein